MPEARASASSPASARPPPTSTASNAPSAAQTRGLAPGPGQLGRHHRDVAAAGQLGHGGRQVAQVACGPARPGCRATTVRASTISPAT